MSSAADAAAAAASGGTSVVEQLQAPLDGLEGPHHLRLEPHQDLRRVVVGAALHLFRLEPGLTNDLVAELLGLASQLAFLDQVRGLLLRPSQYLLRFLAGLLEQPLDLVG